MKGFRTINVGAGSPCPGLRNIADHHYYPHTKTMTQWHLPMNGLKPIVVGVGFPYPDLRDSTDHRFHPGRGNRAPTEWHLPVNRFGPINLGAGSPCPGLRDSTDHRVNTLRSAVSPYCFRRKEGFSLSSSHFNGLFSIYSRARRKSLSFLITCS